MSKENSLFPSIGAVAAQADAQLEKDDTLPAEPTGTEEDGEQLLQEIESLCMRCRLQVHPHICVFQALYTDGSRPGNHSVTAHFHSVLPGNCSHVLSL
jgi:hypothetical protein